MLIVKREKVLASCAMGFLLAGLLVYVTDRLTDTHGLTLRYFPNARFEGSGTSLGSTSILSFEGSKAPRPRFASEEEWSLRYEGFLTIPEEGAYTFFTTSDDGSWLYLNDVLVLDNGGRHPARTVTATRRLEVGVYAIRLDYNQIRGGSRLTTAWAVANNRAEPISPRLLHTRRPDLAPRASATERPSGGTLVAMGLLLVVAARLSRVDLRARLGRIRSACREPETALFLVLLLSQVLPVLTTGFFPSTDGAAHLDGGRAVFRMLRDDGWLTRAYYEFNPRIEPNWVGHLLLGALQLILSAPLAERVLVASYVVLLPVSCRYVVGACKPTGTWVAILVMPFTLNWLLFMGFYNFCLAIPLMFFMIGYWLRHAGAVSTKALTGLTVLSTASFFSHPFPLLMGLGVIGVFLLSSKARDLAEASRGGSSWKVFRRPSGPRTWCTLLGFAPVSILLGVFLLFEPSIEPLPGASLDNVGSLLSTMRNLGVLVSLDDAAEIPAALVFWVFAALAVGAIRWKLARGTSDVWDAWLLPVFATFGLYLVMPDSRSGGQFVTPRLLLFFFLFLAVWLGSIRFPSAVRWTATTVVGTIVLWTSALHASAFARLTPLLTEYVSVAEHLVPNSTLLTLEYRPVGPAAMYRRGIRPFVHAGGYLAGMAGVFNLTNYEGQMGHFPLRFRQDVNPYREIARNDSLEAMPPCVEIVEFNRRTREAVDFVMTWGLEESNTDPCAVSLRRQLADAYALVHTTEPRRLGKLYRRRDFRRYDEVAGEHVP